MFDDATKVDTVEAWYNKGKQDRQEGKEYYKFEDNTHTAFKYSYWKGWNEAR